MKLVVTGIRFVVVTLTRRHNLARSQKIGGASSTKTCQPAPTRPTILARHMCHNYSYLFVALNRNFLYRLRAHLRRQHQTNAFVCVSNCVSVPRIHTSTKYTSIPDILLPENMVVSNLHRAK